MLVYPYKTQVQIVDVSMALRNYIRRKSQDNLAFVEFDRHPNFIANEILTNFMPRWQSYANHKPSWMDNFVFMEVKLV